MKRRGGQEGRGRGIQAGGEGKGREERGGGGRGGDGLGGGREKALMLARTHWLHNLLMKKSDKAHWVLGEACEGASEEGQYRCVPLFPTSAGMQTYSAKQTAHVMYSSDAQTHSPPRQIPAVKQK